MGWKKRLTAGTISLVAAAGIAYGGYRAYADPDIPARHTLIDGVHITYEHKLYALPRYKGGSLLEQSSWDAGYAELTLSEGQEKIIYRDHTGQRPLPDCGVTAWHVMEPEEIILHAGDHTLTYTRGATEWTRGVRQFQRTLQTLWADGCQERDLEHLSPLYVVEGPDTAK